MQTTQPKLSEEQIQVLASALADPADVVTIGGYAGTGKTTIIRELVKALKKVAVCAYTGKAANVLRRKGISASTIHKLIYETLLDEDGKPEKDAFGNPQWVLKTSLNVDCIIIDEGSMVSEIIYNDLLSFGKKIIMVGDHGQLPPVGDDFDLMQDPMYRLETIHRNAGEIARFAHWLREGKDAVDFECKDQSVIVGEFDPLISDNEGKVVPLVDQLICGFNKTRHGYNAYFRKELGFSGQPKEGERIMVLSNNTEYNVFNGMQGVVESVKKNKIVFKDQVDIVRTIPVSFHNHEKNPTQYRVTWGYAYAATCHKMQGDECDSVGVIEEQFEKYWEPARWNYTAASRARTQIYWDPSNA